MILMGLLLLLKETLEVVILLSFKMTLCQHLCLTKKTDMAGQHSGFLIQRFLPS